MLATARKKQGGFTLVETIIAIALLAIALVPLTLSYSFSASHSADAMIEVRVAELGQAYVEEILSKRFDENSAVGGVPACSATTTPCGAIGIDGGESRATFDDVDDYDGLDEQPPRDSTDNVRPGYVGFRVEVAVAYANGSEVTNYNLDATTDLKRILVRVHPPAGAATEFEVYRGNF